MKEFKKSNGKIYEYEDTLTSLQAYKDAKTRAEANQQKDWDQAQIRIDRLKEQIKLIKKL